MTGRPRSGLSYERHVEIGAELNAIRERLMDLACEARTAYPKADPFTRVLVRLTDLMGRAKSQGENHLFREHSERACVHVYYRRDGHRLDGDGVCWSVPDHLPPTARADRRAAPMTGAAATRRAASHGAGVTATP
jgi:hypothetical protein